MPLSIIFFPYNLCWIEMMVGVYVLSFGCLCFIFNECVGVLRAKLLSISLQSYTCMFFCVCENCKCALLWKFYVTCVFLVVCDLWILCLVCFLDIVSCMCFLLSIIFYFCCVSCLLHKSYFLFGFKVMCHLDYLWLVFYVFNLLLSNLGMWIKRAKGRTS